MKEMVKERIWTYEDYLKLEDDKRYEVINGRLVEMPAPGFEHQKISGLIDFILRKFVYKERIGEVLYAPFDVILSENIVVQPDIVFISNENLKNIKEGRLFGPPDLVVEIVSPGSYKRDRFEKFKIYEEFGVKEYWIVLPGEKVIEVWCLKEGKYVLHSIAVEKGEVESCLLKGLKVKVEEVFK
ncbi:MAG: Uma2 family endonuclease [candidate division WOR-3 bacterium]